MLQLVNLPLLPMWAQQLGGILPLTALIDFVDVDMKFHLYELSGSISLWNWPITPAGGRVLVSKHNATQDCYLDRPENSTVLDCFDGRHGDRYPSSTPTTTRTWISAHAVDVWIQNDSEHLRDCKARKQTLEVLQVVQRQQLPSQSRNSNIKYRILEWVTNSKKLYWSISITGWIFWVGLVITGFVTQLHVAVCYLMLMPLTGLIIKLTHGGKPRTLLPRIVEEGCNRVILVTDSINATNWSAMYGKNFPLNSLLNSALVQSSTQPRSIIFRSSLCLMILGQWSMALASCVMQGWDALFIGSWITFCACVSALVYRPEHSVTDWLKYDCKIQVRKISVECSSRRSLLSAVVYINPDTKDGRTKWMDPILSDSSPERAEWETVLLEYIKSGEEYDKTLAEEKYWWKFIVEGVEVGRKIKQVLENEEV